MSENIRIDLPTNELIPGQKLLIPVMIEFDTPTKVRGIHASFVGAEKTEADYTQTKTDSKGKVTTETKTAYEYIYHVKEEFLLFGSERKGCLAGIFDSLATLFGGGDHEVVQPGKQKYVVSVLVPDQLPSTFTGKKCEIYYRLEVSVDIPVAWDWRKTFDFVLPPLLVDCYNSKPVQTSFPDASGRSFWDRWFGKDVTLDFALDRDRVAAGDYVHAFLTVASPEPLTHNGIQTTLVGVEKTRAQGHADSYTHRVPLSEIAESGMLPNESSFEFKISIPEHAGPSTGTGENYSIRWFIEVQIRISWAKDPIIQIPVEYYGDQDSKGNYIAKPTEA